MIVEQCAVKSLKCEYFLKKTVQHKKMHLIPDMFDEKQTFMTSVVLYF